jgi:hypothetical protein
MASLAERARASVERLRSEDWQEWQSFAARSYGPGARQASQSWLTWMAANPNLPEDGLQAWITRRHGRIVGSQGSIPFRLKEGARIGSASWAVDLMVDAEWRLRGVGPALSSAHLAASELVCGVGVSDAAYRAYIRAGWLDLGPVPNYVRPSDPRWSLQSIGLHGGRRIAAEVIARPMLGLTRLWSTIAAHAAGTRLQAIASFDERADHLWRREAGSYPVIAVRDRATLAWRFDSPVQAEPIHRYYLMRDEGVLGYVVTRVQLLRERPTLVILDYFTRPQWLLPLLGHVIGLPQARDTVAISCHTLNPTGDLAFRAAGFVPTVGGGRTDALFHVNTHRIVLMVHRGGAPDRLAFHRAHWFLASGDSDLSLWYGGGNRATLAS